MIGLLNDICIGFDGTKSRTCGSSSGYGQDDIEIIDVDDYWINRKGNV